MEKREPSRKWKDPCALTPYEQRIVDMLSAGQTVPQVAETLGLKSVNGLRAKICVIREKKNYAQ